MRPDRGELKCREFDDYQAVYCGLCRALGQRYGILARSLLQYDFVFLAMLFAQPGASVRTEIHRCPICPLRKKRMYTGHPELDRAADQMVILAWWKLRDTVEDESFLRGLPARVLSRLLRRDYRRAAGRRPGFDEAARAGLERLRQLAYTDLDAAVLLGTEMSVEELAERGVPVHPNTLAARDFLKGPDQ